MPKRKVWILLLNYLLFLSWSYTNIYIYIYIYEKSRVRASPVIVFIELLLCVYIYIYIYIWWWWWWADLADPEINIISFVAHLDCTGDNKKQVKITSTQAYFNLLTFLQTSISQLTFTLQLVEAVAIAFHIWHGCARQSTLSCK